MNRKTLLHETRFRATILAVIVILLTTTGALADAGELDTTFDGDGKVITDLGGTEAIFDIAIQPDGKIVAAGYKNTSSGYDFAVARYNLDGSLDASFDSDGVVITDALSTDNTGYAVAIQTDGKIVVAGNVCYGSNNCDFALARYNSDGSLDASFDGDGIVVTYIASSSDTCHAVALQTDGKIVALGITGSLGIQTSYIVVRYNSDGSLDPSFDGDGKAVVRVGYLDYPSDVAIQANGKIIAAGTSTLSKAYQENRISLIRLNEDGSPDSGFGDAGELILDFSYSGAKAIALVPKNGKIVVAGTSNNNFAAARLNEDGSFDVTFDGDGKVITDFGNRDVGNAVAIQQDGKTVVAGIIGDGGTENFALARYNRDGSLDTSFSGDGKLTTDIQGMDWVFSMALQADAKIVLAGSSGTNFALARYDEGGLAFLSDATQDGLILESAETSGKGETINVTSVLRLGDNAARKQYRSLLSFQTDNLPDNAILTSVTLKLKRQGVTGGGDPIALFQGILVDVKRGFFGNSSTLQITDWQALGQKTIGPLTPTYGGGWYSLDLTSLKGYVNKRELNQGLTQIRIRFNLDDNDDSIANYLSLFSGNGAVTSRPILLIDYVMP
ncbi:MAG: hypothetical protein HY867_12480 [Chloroflexi bacterium]|nr:hypothetical protein [Chloroflexota bacterium]